MGAIATDYKLSTENVGEIFEMFRRGLTRVKSS